MKFLLADENPFKIDSDDSRTTSTELVLLSLLLPLGK